MLSWPPNYTHLFQERQRRFVATFRDPVLQLGAKTFYKDKPVDFIRDWGITYDPRNIPKQLPTTIPFELFPRQVELIEFLSDCLFSRENGLVEKARDFGATWCCVGFSVWLWLFHEGSSVGWGSRKEQYVDKLGDPDSIFEKIRMFIDALPPWFKPGGFFMNKHSSYMKMVNPENGATITGEAGDNIGRGGRSLIYFKDESSHYERPEKIEAALGDNTDVQIDISSVNGTGNVFHRRRFSGSVWRKDREIRSGQTRVFIMDWKDHPGKSDEWYNTRREKAEREGLLHIFKQEVDRDYTSAVEGLLIPGEWVKAARDAHLKIKGMEKVGAHFAGFDPYDEGLDSHALVARRGPIMTLAKMWYKGDTGQAARKVINLCREHKITHLQYDGVGVGAGVKTETNRLNTLKALPRNLKIVAWRGDAAVLNPNKRLFPEDPSSVKLKDFYKNLKAQGWWELRLRFERTFKAVTQGEIYDPEELISLPSVLEYLSDLENELSQPTYTHDSAGRIIINKKPAGTKSPNLADGAVMAYWPIIKIHPQQTSTVGAPAGIKNTRNLNPDSEAA